MRGESRYRTRLARALATLLLIGSAGTIPGLAQSRLSGEARRVLSEMDARSKTLRTLTADLKQTKVTIVVDDVSEKTGKALLQEVVVGEAAFKLDYAEPEFRTLLLEKGKVKILEPRIKRYQEIDTRNGSATAELRRFFIGQSSRSIRRDYDVLPPQGGPG